MSLVACCSLFGVIVCCLLREASRVRLDACCVLFGVRCVMCVRWACVWGVYAVSVCCVWCVVCDAWLLCVCCIYGDCVLFV